MEESDWETASEDDDDDDEGSLPQVDWELTRSFFDNHISSSFESNLEYMWKKFGFYLPDTEYLEDPEGLFKYLVYSPPPQQRSLAIFPLENLFTILPSFPVHFQLVSRSGAMKLLFITSPLRALSIKFGRVV